jgi:glycosyltransferase involved in cell wall biosynthesis
MKTPSIILVTHHFPPEVNGTATRAFEIAKRIIKKYPGIRLFVISPPPVRPFGRFHVDLRPLRIIKLGDNLYLIRVWSYQPISPNPSVLERLFNYIIFPIFAIPIVIGLGLFSKRTIFIIPPSTLTIIVPFIKPLRNKIIVDITDLWHEEAQLLGYIKSRLLTAISKGAELFALKLAHVITVATYSIGKYYVYLLGNKKRIYTLPTPIDELLAKKCRDTKPLLSSNTSYDTIVYAGNFGKPQALDFAIKAFKILEERGVKVKLLLIGGGEEERSLKHLVNILGVNNVEIRPPVPREELFSRIYPQASAGLLALSYARALFYAIPTKMYEYIVCELPIVAYGSSIEAKHVITKWHLGVYVAENDPQKLAEAIMYLMNNKHLFIENTRKYALYLTKQVYEVLDTIIYDKA